MANRINSFIFVLFIFIWLFPYKIYSENTSEADIDIEELSIEELMEVKVTSVSKKIEKLVNSPAAIYVITQDDIKKFGATSLPEILRMAPGMQVSRNDLTDWDVNIRGLNEFFSNKLLVLIDGRSVYTPIFSGVFWDIQDTMLDDIDRIEIIRGPGASLWGSNAVNGVINIITKNPKNTQGVNTSILGGNKEITGNVRYGGKIKDNIYYRFFVKKFDREKLSDSEDKDDNSKNEINAHNYEKKWVSNRGGFQLELNMNDKNSLSIKSEVYENQFKTNYYEVSFMEPYVFEKEGTSDAFGCYVLTDFKRTISETSDFQIKTYFDRAEKEHLPTKASVDTFDVDFQYHISLCDTNDIVWGLGYRYIMDSFRNSNILGLYPDKLNQKIFSGFIQDEIYVCKDIFHVTFGSKFEYNDFTEFEIQPSVKFLWNFKESHSLWGSISRAVRVPSRIERDGLILQWYIVNEDQYPLIVQDEGTDSLNSEVLMAYELGYRVKPYSNIWMDSTIFYNDYRGLVNGELGEIYIRTNPVPHYVQPVYFKNILNGQSYGFELASDWQALNNIRFRAAYSYLKTNVYYENLQEDAFFEITGALPPRNQFILRSAIDLTRTIQADFAVKFVDRLVKKESKKEIESYTDCNFRIAWTPFKTIEFALAGQNLFKNKHLEQSDIQVDRIFYLKMTYEN
ncbi:MAG: TonB-dependent receptor [Desulfobacterales bacterium]|nr:TonB-dependent receptor [Desulfobacterales bacterium]